MTITGLPFQISDLPKGISMRSDGNTLTLHAEPGVSGTVIARLEGPEVISGEVHVVAERGSHIRFVILQNKSDQATVKLNTFTRAEEGARIDLFQFHLGGASATGSIVQEAVGEEATLNTDLLCRTRADQKYRFNLKNIYRKRNGRGRMTAKGAATDNSVLGMHGCIAISRTGGGTDAHLTQDSLLLSRNAKIKATPSLEIDTNDVKAAHGASISNLDDESLFYLTSRGVEREDARQMMVHGFLKEQLKKIEDLADLKEEIELLI